MWKYGWRVLQLPLKMGSSLNYVADEGQCCMRQTRVNVACGRRGSMLHVADEGQCCMWQMRVNGACGRRELMLHVADES